MGSIDPVIHAAGLAASAAVFGIAAWRKWRRLPAFEAAFAAYGLLPARAAPLVPLAETAGVIGLLYGPTRVAAALGLEGLLVLFVVALIVNLRRGNDAIACGCGGFAGAANDDATGIGYRHVARAAAIGLIPLPVLFAPGERTLLATDYATVAFATLFVLALVHTVDFLFAQAADLDRGRVKP
ncbi:MauE/DoxX family redox-associated membrane protein [Burkholderia stabilis]|uniref:Methylamine utilization protein MauE n=1 Tax=Burkholderia stabilis TaxID=95485 RepID=A0AAJ5NED7_9BURK|nr:MauE/DoxX family redox-associated membrane protein [Burkholderia stabilis]VBB16935.1 Methylamine utilisation protein MauE [Burkholderia stabilis]